MGRNFCHFDRGQACERDQEEAESQSLPIIALCFQNRRIQASSHTGTASREHLLNARYTEMEKSCE